MKIDYATEDTIIVELSDADMKELEITYDEMDYSNLETRRVIWTLLDRASHTLGRDIDPSGRLKIEVIPDKDGGCLLFFTMNAEDEPTVSPEVLVYETSDSGTLIDCARLLSPCRAVKESELYKNERSYRLILTMSEHCEPPIGFGEFLSLSGTLYEARYTREHWTALLSSNALIRLCG